MTSSGQFTKGKETMPYLQLDVPKHYAVEVKRALAQRLGDSYARIMQTTPELVTVSFRELGQGGVWSCGAGEPEPGPCSHVRYGVAAQPNSALNWRRH
jgi:phenylpyruvate tautomerase PptA (4-oxalocrotonate tautomerase family)